MFIIHGSQDIDKDHMIATGISVLDHCRIDVANSKNNHDDALQGFWLCDRSRLPYSANTPGLINTFARILFYTATIGEYVKIFVLQVVHRKCTGDIFFFSPSKCLQIDNAVCQDLQGFDLVRSHEEIQTQRSLVNLLARGTLHSAKTVLKERNLPLNYIAEDSTRQTLQTMLQRGYKRCTIPIYFGGDYDHHIWDDWIRSRLSVEEIMGSAAPIPNAELAKSGNRMIELRSSFYPWHQRDEKQTKKAPFQPIVKRLPHESEEDFERRRGNLYAKRFTAKSAEKHKSRVR